MTNFSESAGFSDKEDLGEDPIARAMRDLKRENDRLLRSFAPDQVDQFNRSPPRQRASSDWMPDEDSIPDAPLDAAHTRAKTVYDKTRRVDLEQPAILENILNADQAGAEFFSVLETLINSIIETLHQHRQELERLQAYLERVR